MIKVSSKYGDEVQVMSLSHKNYYSSLKKLYCHETKFAKHFVKNSIFCHKYYSSLKITFIDKKFYLSLKITFTNKFFY